jgi:hypothetical protein
VLIGPSDQQLGLLAGLQMWRDQFLGVLLAFVIIRDGAGSLGEVILMDQVCWIGDGGFVVFPDFIGGR